MFTSITASKHSTLIIACFILIVNTIEELFCGAAFRSKKTAVRRKRALPLRLIQTFQQGQVGCIEPAVSVQTTGGGDLPGEQKAVTDINGDGLVDSSDASLILEYYAYVSTDGSDTADVYFSKEQEIT